VICDLSASPMMDLAGARSLAELYEDLRVRGMTLTIVNAHGRVRDLLRAEGFGEKIHGIVRGATISDALRDLADATATIAQPMAIKGAPDTPGSSPAQRPDA
jgi:MFS superfamily sulfate permease-like transporter